MTSNLKQFDEARAWTLREARESGKLDRHGIRPHLSQVGRWAKHGDRPYPGGPLIKLFSIIAGRRRLTMPEWVEAFVKARQAALTEQLRREMDLAGLGPGRLKGTRNGGICPAGPRAKDRSSRTG